MDVFSWSLPFVGEKSKTLGGGIVCNCFFSSPYTPILSFPFPLLHSLSLISVVDMLLAILNTVTREELDDEEEVKDPSKAESDARKAQLKRKIMAVGKMARTFQVLR